MYMFVCMILLIWRATISFCREGVMMHEVLVSAHYSMSAQYHSASAPPSLVMVCRGLAQFVS